MVSSGRLGVLRMVSRYPWMLLTGVFSSCAMFCVSWRFRRACCSSWVMSMMDISNDRSWKMMHSTENERPFLSTCKASLFSSLLKFPSLRFRNSVMGCSSAMLNTSSVEARLWSEMVLAYCVNRLFTSISFRSRVNTPSPSCEVCRCDISFSRSMYSASFVRCRRWYILMMCSEISPSSFLGNVSEVSIRSFRSARNANCCSLAMDVPSFCV